MTREEWLAEYPTPHLVDYRDYQRDLDALIAAAKAEEREECAKWERLAREASGLLFGSADARLSWQKASNAWLKRYEICVRDKESGNG